jgi:hypothetical protein
VNDYLIFLNISGANVCELAWDENSFISDFLIFSPLFDFYPNKFDEFALHFPVKITTCA